MRGHRNFREFPTFNVKRGAAMTLDEIAAEIGTTKADVSEALKTGLRKLRRMRALLDEMKGLADELEKGRTNDPTLEMGEE